MLAQLASGNVGPQGPTLKLCTSLEIRHQLHTVPPQHLAGEWVGWDAAGGYRVLQGGEIVGDPAGGWGGWGRLWGVLQVSGWVVGSGWG